MGDQVSRLRTVSESSGFSRKRLVFGLKVAVFIVSLWPVTEIVIAFLTGNTRLFGANPAEKILHRTGDWAIYFLLITLAISPLRRIIGLNDLIKFRRMAGLFAFFYAFLHLMSYIAFDRFFYFDEILQDIFKRPFIFVGIAAFILLIPLAVTSTRGWVQRLGGHRWTLLHRSVYIIAILGVVHYWWLVKRDILWPLIYAGILILLLGYRLLPKKRFRG
jgi:sulfoxide reductase heme-binding subunit YedZ